MAAIEPPKSNWFCPLAPPTAGCPLHFYVEATLNTYPDREGLIVTVGFGNVAVPGCSQNVEVWHPIAGHLDLLNDQKVIPLAELVDMSGYPAGGVRNMLIAPGSASDPLQFYAWLGSEVLDLLRRLAEENGTVTLILHLSFSVLYSAGLLSQKTYSCYPLIRFEVPKRVVESWGGAQRGRPQRQA